jgi:hypothetical protein
VNIVAKIMYRKMRETACLADEMFTSQGGFCFTLVGQSLGLLVSQSVVQSVNSRKFWEMYVAVGRIDFAFFLR